MTAAAAPSRAERRKRETRERLLAAALEVFLRRGFDTATTAEIATAADLGAGTFYLHFRDKRDAYESLARRASREMIDRWQEAVRPDTALSERLALALEKVAEFWAEDVNRARLLLEGGPTLGSLAHAKLLHDLAKLLESDVRRARTANPALPAAEIAALVVVGLGLELGRVIVAGTADAAEIVRGTIETLRRAFATPRLRAAGPGPRPQPRHRPQN
ncbi:MAG: hypothetical protein QOD06_3473 [Candidatus Binatota bacterium]|nr:hypothetical protein [Candidatus Binatota bacterium]